MKSLRTEREGVRVIPAGDIHDIRVLTATGPIELPATAAAEPERRAV